MMKEKKDIAYFIVVLPLDGGLESVGGVLVCAGGGGRE